jgi:hypothetical protein
MRIASKSVMGLVSSNGLERYKTSSVARIHFGDALSVHFPVFQVTCFALSPAPGSALL